MTHGSADGDSVIMKRRSGAPPGFFAAEAAGLRWLAAARAVPVPEVVEINDEHIALRRIPAGRPTVAGAEALGRGLADLHAAGADRFGAPWAGFIGPLPMPNHDAADWPTFYVDQRVLPFLRMARDQGAVNRGEAAEVERALGGLASLPGADEAPARLHGDLWSGNVVWDPSAAAWLIDPAAHGGHRESDLAMLALFGAPHLERILSAYDERQPLATGWRERVPLHQLHPLLVHAALFGAGYGRQAVAAARSVPH